MSQNTVTRSHTPSHKGATLLALDGNAEMSDEDKENRVKP